MHCNTSHGYTYQDKNGATSENDCFIFLYYLYYVCCKIIIIIVILTGLISVLTITACISDICKEKRNAQLNLSSSSTDGWHMKSNMFR